jgi:ketosteroid isomerase-like protein
LQRVAENLERIKPIVAQWATGNFTGGLELIADDIIHTGYVPEGVLTFRGRERFLRWLGEFFSQWRDYRVEAEELTELGDDAILIAGRQIGTGASSGVEITEPVFIVLVFREGKIVGNHWHVDRGEALMAAGFGEGAG